MPSRRAGAALGIGLGASIAQGVAIIVSLVLARLVLPAQFGVYATLSAIVGVVGVASTLRYDMAIPLPKREEVSVGLLRAALSSALATSLLAAVLLLTARESLANRLGTDDLGTLLLVPVAVLLAGVFSALNQLALRRKRYALVAQRTVVQAVTAGVAQVALAAWSPSPTSLMLGLVLGQSASVILLWANLKEAAPLRRSTPPWREYRRFPLLLVIISHF